MMSGNVQLAFASLSTLCLTSIAAAASPPITSVVFSPDGDSVVACSQRGLQVYRWPSLQLRESYSTSLLNLHDVAFSPSGDLVALGGGTPGDEGALEVFSWPEVKSQQILGSHIDSVMSLAWINETTLASASLDHDVILWDTKSGSRTTKLKGHSRGVASLSILRNQKLLVSAGIDQSVRVWNLEAGELVHSLNIHTLPVHGLALRPGDNGLPVVASASEDRTVRLWQPTIGRMVRFARLSSIPLDVAWLPDGSRIVVCCTDGHVCLIDPDSVEVTQDIPVLDGWAYSLAVHPRDGSLLVGGSDGQLRAVDPSREK